MRYASTIAVGVLAVCLIASSAAALRLYTERQQAPRRPILAGPDLGGLGPGLGLTPPGGLGSGPLEPGTQPGVAGGGPATGGLPGGLPGGPAGGPGGQPDPAALAFFQAHEDIQRRYMRTAGIIERLARMGANVEPLMPLSKEFHDAVRAGDAQQAQSVLDRAEAELKRLLPSGRGRGMPPGMPRGMRGGMAGRFNALQQEQGKQALLRVAAAMREEMKKRGVDLPEVRRLVGEGEALAGDGKLQEAQQKLREADAALREKLPNPVQLIGQFMDGEAEQLAGMQGALQQAQQALKQGNSRQAGEQIAAALAALDANAAARQELATYVQGNAPPQGSGPRPGRGPGPGGQGPGGRGPSGRGPGAQGGPPPQLVQAVVNELAAIRKLSEAEFTLKSQDVARNLLQAIVGSLRPGGPGAGGPGVPAPGPQGTGSQSPLTDPPGTGATGPPAPGGQGSTPGATTPRRPQIGPVELPAEEPSESSQRTQLEQALREEFRSAQELYLDLKRSGADLKTVEGLIGQAREALNAGRLVEAGETLTSAVTIMGDLKEQPPAPPSGSSPGTGPQPATSGDSSPGGAAGTPAQPPGGPSPELLGPPPR